MSRCTTSWSWAILGSTVVGLPVVEALALLVLLWLSVLTILESPMPDEATSTPSPPAVVSPTRLTIASSAVAIELASKLSVTALVWVTVCVWERFWLAALVWVSEFTFDCIGSPAIGRAVTTAVADARDVALTPSIGVVTVPELSISTTPEVEVALAS